MNHSLIGADRATHLKIVSVALAAAVAVIMAAALARVTKGEAIAITAGQSAMFATYATTIIR